MEIQDRDLKTFNEKTAIITGAGSGLGHSFALQLYAAGAHLALCDMDFSGIKETFHITGETGNRISQLNMNTMDN